MLEIAKIKWNDFTEQECKNFVTKDYIETRVLAHYQNTCSGFECQRCPVNFVEQKQRCVQCPPGMIAGWKYNDIKGTTEEENTCITVNAPIGHFIDFQNPKGVTIGNVNYPYTTH